jgi:hypothetical protein
MQRSEFKDYGAIVVKPETKQSPELQEILVVTAANEDAARAMIHKYAHADGWTIQGRVMKVWGPLPPSSLPQRIDQPSFATRPVKPEGDPGEDS